MWGLNCLDGLIKLEIFVEPTSGLIAEIEIDLIGKLFLASISDWPDLKVNLFLHDLETTS